MEACRDELTVTPERINMDEFHYAVAETGSDIVGYYALEKCSLHEYEVEALFVKPKYIGKGIGKM